FCRALCANHRLRCAGACMPRPFTASVPKQSHLCWLLKPLNQPYAHKKSTVRTVLFSPLLGINLNGLVGARGFEPPTPTSRTTFQRAIRLKESNTTSLFSTTYQIIPFGSPAFQAVPRGSNYGNLVQIWYSLLPCAHALPTSPGSHHG